MYVGGKNMPLDVQYNKSSGLIEIIYSGEVTASELADAVSKRIIIQKETGALGVLADASAVQITPSTMDLFNLPDKLFSKQDAPRRTKIAVVLPKLEQPRNKIRFLETASRNRSWFMQIFDERQNAVAWLMKQTTSNETEC